MLNYSRISSNGGYHSLFVVPVVSLIHSILQPNLDLEDPNVLFETKAIYFFVLFTYRQVTKSNWINLTSFGLRQNVKVLTTTTSLLWYQRTAVLLTYYHGRNPKKLKSSRLHCYSRRSQWNSTNFKLISEKFQSTQQKLFKTYTFINIRTFSKTQETFRIFTTSYPQSIGEEIRPGN